MAPTTTPFTKVTIEVDGRTYVAVEPAFKKVKRSETTEDSGVATPTSAEEDEQMEEDEEESTEDAKDEGNEADDAKDKADDEIEEEKKDDEKAEGEEEEGPAGMSLKEKALYGGPSNCDCCISWEKELPDGVSLDESQSKGNDVFALIVRHQRKHDSDKVMQFHSVVIQSPLIKNVLSKVLEGYPGITVNVSQFVLKPPFKPLIHRRKELKAAMEADMDDETRSHMERFTSAISRQFEKCRNEVEELMQQDVITFDHVWAVFEPGKDILFQIGGEPCIMKFESGEFAESTMCGKYFKLTGTISDCNGQYLGERKISTNIMKFAGTHKISDLAAVPLDRLEKEHRDTLVATLVSRGKIFESMISGHHYKQYSGIATFYDEDDKLRSTDVDGRVIIDPFGYCRYNSYHAYTPLPFKVKEDKEKKVVREGDHDNGDSDPEDGYWNGDEFVPNDSDRLERFARAKSFTPMTKEQLMRCSPIIRGYGLRKKKWLELYVSNVSDIQFNDSAFDTLVLPKEEKDLILALTEAQVDSKQSFDDIIAGKGQGLVMLLSGPPGVGKTLTAEALSELTHNPLYYVSSGQLGSDVYNVDRELTQILDMCGEWNCIVLLDEADAFLAKRDPTNLERNAMISIFLRQLEYYEGILVLTTNRLEDIDPAFESRVHVRIAYSDLTPASRFKIWKNFMVRAISTHGENGSKVDDEGLRELSKISMNGREIKNVLKSAQMLARRKRETFGMQHIKTVMAVTQNKWTK